MTPHVPSLLVAVAAAIAIVSASSAAIGIRQRLRRGLPWWLGANCGVIGAFVCHAFVSLPGSAVDSTTSMVAALGAALALQWPITTIAGMRRFFARGHGGVPPWADVAVLSVAVIATVGVWLAPFGGVSPETVFAAAMLVVTGHAVLAVSRLEDFAATPMLRSLVTALLCSAAAQATWLVVAMASLIGIDTAHTALVALLATGVTALMLPQLTLAMNHERNVASLRTSHRKLRHMVDVDTLTRLPNRRHFLDLATRATKAAPELATVLTFDIDSLRHINNVLGHAVGDEALRQVGTVLRETLRRRDVAGRLGGDDFAVVLPRTKVEDAAPVIARVKAAINDRQVAPRIARVAVNVGATQMLAGESLGDAVRRAQQQLETSRDAARVQAQAEATLPLARPPRAVDAAPAATAAASVLPTIVAPLTPPPPTPSPPSSRPASVARDSKAAAFARSSSATPLNMIPIGEVVD